MPNATFGIEISTQNINTELCRFRKLNTVYQKSIRTPEIFLENHHKMPENDGGETQKNANLLINHWSLTPND